MLLRAVVAPILHPLLQHVEVHVDDLVREPLRQMVIVHQSLMRAREWGRSETTEAEGAGMVIVYQSRRARGHGGPAATA